jgi:hypothetical protein
MLEDDDFAELLKTAWPAPPAHLVDAVVRRVAQLPRSQKRPESFLTTGSGIAALRPYPLLLAMSVCIIAGMFSHPLLYPHVKNLAWYPSAGSYLMEAFSR